MIDPVDRAVRAIARRNSYALVWAQFGSRTSSCSAASALLAPDQPMSTTQFLVLPERSSRSA